MAKKLPGLALQKQQAKEDADVKRKVTERFAKTVESKAATRGKGEGTGLMVMVPQATMRWLKDKAHEGDTTTRAIVLEGLRKLGAPLTPDELTDRRRKA